jgi:hypothetical protein
MIAFFRTQPNEGEAKPPERNPRLGTSSFIRCNTYPYFVRTRTIGKLPNDGKKV